MAQIHSNMLLAKTETIENKIGYISPKGEWVISPLIEYGGDVDGDYIKIQEGEKSAIMDRKGNIIVREDSIRSFYLELYGDYVGYMKSPYSTGPHEKNGYMGTEKIYLATSGLLYLPDLQEIDFKEFCQIKEISTENNRVAIHLNSKWGFTDLTGKVVIAPMYDDVGKFYEGYAVVNREDKWGCIDSSGNVVIPVEHEYVGNCSEGYMTVLSEGLFGLMNTKGKWVIQPSYSYLGKVKQGMLTAGNDVNYKILFDRTIAIVGSAKWGVLNVKEEEILPFRYNAIEEYNEGVFIVRTDKGSTAIDVTGKPIFDSWFDDMRSYSNGFASVKKGNLWGVIDKKGKWVIKPEFKYIGAFK